MKKAGAAVDMADTVRAKPRGPAILTGHEPTVDRLVELTAQIALHQDEIGELRARLDAAADGLRVSTEERTGHACKSMQARGTDINGRYIFADKYAPLNPDIAPQLEGELGTEAFGRLFVADEIVKLKPGVAHHLLELLRELDRVDEFLAVDPCLRPVEEFREARAGLRRELTPAQNRELDAVVAQIAERPRLSLK